MGKSWVSANSVHKNTTLSPLRAHQGCPLQPRAEELSKLLGLPEFMDSLFRLQQFSIWVITDNPPRGGFMGLGSADQGSPPSADELVQIRQWFETAGIAVENYPVCVERQKLAVVGDRLVTTERSVLFKFAIELLRRLHAENHEEGDRTVKYGCIIS
jgi:hypothetical protein